MVSKKDLNLFHQTDMDHNRMGDHYNEVVDLLREIYDDHEVIRDKISWDSDRNRILSTEDPVLFTLNGSTKDRIDIPAFSYMIDGQVYHKAAEAAADWDQGGETINVGAAASQLWGAWYVLINKLGVISSIPTDVSGDSAYVTEFAAIMAINGTSDNDISDLDLENKCLIGIITVQNDTNDDFVADTTEFDHADLNDYNFYWIDDVDANTVLYSTNDGDGRVITPHSSLAIDATPEDYKTVGTAIAKILGLQVSQAAQTGQSFAVADTINTGGAATALWGGFLVLMDAAGTLFTLAAHGGVVAADMVYASAALVQVALDALVIPPMFAKVGQIIINGKVSTAWTANTGDMTDASDVLTATFTAEGAATAYLADDNESTVVKPAVLAGLGSTEPDALTT